MPVLGTSTFRVRPGMTQGRPRCRPHRYQSGGGCASRLKSAYGTRRLFSIDARPEVSKRLKTDFENGREYYALHGREIALPEKFADHPARDFLAWHNENCFVG